MSCTVSNTFDFYLRQAKQNLHFDVQNFTGYYAHALIQLKQNGLFLTKVVFIRVVNVKKCLEIGQLR